jgi:choloylglycine hydrolase
MAGLNFPKSAYYHPPREDMLNLASFELIPYILGSFKTVDEAVAALEKINICNTSFGESFAATPLHWIIADKERSIVLESRIDGLHIFENGANVLTNEPSFENQLANLANFAKLTGDEPPAKEGITPVSRGLGAFGLPGDYSSPSRFVRAAFLLENADRGEDITQFFRILGSVEVPCGAVRLKDGKRVITHYTSCINLSGGIYFYKTYTNSRISGVDMRKEELDGCDIVSYPLIKTQDILMQN